MSKYKTDDIKNMSAAQVMELGVDDVQEVGFKTAPAGTYNFHIESAAIQEFQGKKDNPDFEAIVVELKPTDVLAFVEGPDHETPEELLEKGADSVPDKVNFMYPLPDRAANFRTDWGRLGKALTKKESMSLREVMEALAGNDIQGTLTYYRKSDDDGNQRIFLNIKDVVPQTIGDE